MICVKVGTKLKWQVVVPGKTVTPAAPAKPTATVARCDVGQACQLGSVGPGGGKVYWAAMSNSPWGHYLEVAPAGWSGSSEDPKAPWCDNVNQSLKDTVTQIRRKKMDSAWIWGWTIKREVLEFH